LTLEPAEFERGAGLRDAPCHGLERRLDPLGEALVHGLLLRGVGAVISAFVTLLRLNISRATRANTSARMVVFSAGC
jgi:hypothetical protein